MSSSESYLDILLSESGKRVAFLIAYVCGTLVTWKCLATCQSMFIPTVLSRYSSSSHSAGYGGRDGRDPMLAARSEGSDVGVGYDVVLELGVGLR
jgi:hypothetical protein